MIMKTKDELKKESKERFKIHILAARKDLNTVSKKLDDIELHTEQAKEVSAESTNVLLGIRRDLLIAVDSLNRISRNLKRGEGNEKTTIKQNKLDE